LFSLGPALHDNVKALLSILSMILCGGCVNTTGVFVQGNIRVVPPVTQLGYDTATHIEKIGVFNDGGTHSFTIRDATGKQFDVYVDHRIGSPTPGAIYLHAYPGEPGSVRIVDQREFKHKIRSFE
jgi:hypothetical protein